MVRTSERDLILTGDKSPAVSIREPWCLDRRGPPAPAGGGGNPWEKVPDGELGPHGGARLSAG